jgi:hypothetical protein
MRPEHVRRQAQQHGESPALDRAERREAHREHRARSEQRPTAQAPAAQAAPAAKPAAPAPAAPAPAAAAPQPRTRVHRDVEESRPRQPPRPIRARDS